MKGKKPYQKPQVKEVKMVPQEAFLASVCKASAGGNQQPGRCRTSKGCGTNIIGS
jgi:hypothetical protein